MKLNGFVKVPGYPLNSALVKLDYLKAYRFTPENHQTKNSVHLDPTQMHGNLGERNPIETKTTKNEYPERSLIEPTTPKNRRWGSLNSYKK